MVSCYRGLLYFVVRASLPLVAGLLCYHGLVLWCVGLQLCHWSLRSARAWVLGAAPGLCPPLGHTVRPRRVGLRPLLHWPRSAARLVVFGRAPVRLACNAPAAFCRHTGFVDCGWVFFRRQARVSRPFCTAFGPALWLGYEQLCLAHCESLHSTAARSGGIEKVSARFCINIKGAQKLLRSTSRGEQYWRSTATPAGLHRAPSREAR